MNQKNIGYTLIIIGILIMGLTYYFKVRSDYYILQIIGDGGSCILDDGTCLHVDLQSPLLIIGYVLSSAVILFGLFLSFIDKGHERLIVEQQKVSQALASATKHEKEKDEFKAFLSGFDLNEQKIISAVHKQEGIKQSTLRYKVDMSKTSLSLMLKNLEERKIIKRTKSGKTNQVYLIKKF